MALLKVRNPAGGFYEFDVLSGKQGNSIYYGEINEDTSVYIKIEMPENWTARVNDLILDNKGQIWQIKNIETKSVVLVASALEGTGLYQGTVVADEDAASSDETNIVETIIKPNGKPFIVGDMVLDENGTVWRIINQKGNVQTVISIKGPQGIQGEQGPQGADGKSAYEIALDEGFEGSEAEWLASLVGDKGEQGIQGPQGPIGPQGPQGETGMPEPIYAHYIFFNYVGATDGSFQINFIIINNEKDDYSASKAYAGVPTPDIAYQSYRLWNALYSIKPSGPIGGPIGVSGSRKSSEGQMYIAQSVKAYIELYADGDKKRLITLNSTGLSNNSNFGEDTVDFSCGLIQDKDGSDVKNYCYQKFTIIDSVFKLA